MSANIEKASRGAEESAPAQDVRGVSARVRFLSRSSDPPSFPSGPETEAGAEIDLGLSIDSAPDTDLQNISGRSPSPLTLADMLPPGTGTVAADPQADRTPRCTFPELDDEDELRHSNQLATAKAPIHPGRRFTIAGPTTLQPPTTASQHPNHSSERQTAGRFRAYLEQHGLSGLGRAERMTMLVNLTKEDATNMLTELLDLVHESFIAHPSPSVAGAIGPKPPAQDHRSTAGRSRRSILSSSGFLAASTFNLSLSGLSGGLWPRLPTVKSESSLPVPSLTTHLEEGEDPAGFPTLNDYTILGEAGSGSYGSVHIATTPEGECRAIKVVRKEPLRKRWHQMLQRATALRTDTAEESARLDNDGDHDPTKAVDATEDDSTAQFTAAVNKELEVMKKLHHKNIVHLYEVIDDPDENLLYLVMPYIERGPVVRLSPEGTCEPLDIDVARGYMRQIVDAVRYLHERHIVHRDIKPDNLLLGSSGRVFVSDFGVSRLFEDGEESPLDQMVGTPAFMAPECFPEIGGNSSANRPKRMCGKPVDVWALGVTLYVMLLGHLPFIAPTTAELGAAIQRDPPEFIPLTAFSAGSRPEYSAAFDLLRRMLRKDPASRITIEGCSRHRFLRFASHSDGTTTTSLCSPCSIGSGSASTTT